MIVGGSGGVSCKRSWAIPGMGVLELTAEYEVELPVPVFHIPVLHYKEKLRMKTWTGYVKTYEAGIGDNELVYVTEIRDRISPELSVHLSGTVRAQCCENTVRGTEKKQWRNLSFV